MSTTDLQQYLMEVFDWSSNEDGEITSMETFEERGLMTSNNGIVIKMRDDSEFQITIVKSK